MICLKIKYSVFAALEVVAMLGIIWLAWSWKE
jgi:hypothetical protein